MFRFPAYFFVGSIVTAMVVAPNVNDVTNPYLVATLVSIVVIGFWLLWAALNARTSVNPLNLAVLLLCTAALYAAVVAVESFLGPRFILTSIPVVALVTVVLAVRRWKQVQRQRRELAGHCGACGYDLRESHDRCPECGTEIPEELARRRRIAAMLAAQRESILHPIENDQRPLTDVGEGAALSFRQTADAQPPGDRWTLEIPGSTGNDEHGPGH